jgi:hypothetical protein
MYVSYELMIVMFRIFMCVILLSLQIKKLNKMIVTLGEDLRKYALSKLVTMRQRADQCVIEKEQVLDQINRDMKRERKSNENGAGPSRTKKRGAKPK